MHVFSALVCLKLRVVLFLFSQFDPLFYSHRFMTLAVSKTRENSSTMCACTRLFNVIVTAFSEKVGKQQRAHRISLMPF